MEAGSVRVAGSWDDVAEVDGRMTCSGVDEASVGDDSEETSGLGVDSTDKGSEDSFSVSDEACCSG